MNLDLEKLEKMSMDKRYQYLLKQVAKSQKIWILVGDGGSVLLKSDNEDCVPIWPHKKCAELFVKDEWSDCTVKGIYLEDWHERWTPGLTEDELLIAGFPNNQEECMVVEPQEFDDDFMGFLK